MREEAIDRMLAGEPKVSIEASMGVTTATLSKWLRQYKQAGEEIDQHLMRRGEGPRTLLNLTRNVGQGLSHLSLSKP